MKVYLSLPLVLVCHDAVAFVSPIFATRSTSTILLAASSPQPPKNIDIINVKRKRWGMDKDHPDEYWFNAKIHTLGNTGMMGALHAAVAPFATKMIDDVAYEGVDVRQAVSGTQSLM
jgi:hypothetical protein